MNRIILTLVLSLCLLFGLTAPTYAMEPEDIYWLTDSLDTGLVYGPPIPQKAPLLPKQLASRGGDQLLQHVDAQNVPDTLTYKVQSGDSLSGIANPHQLNVNQELKVPNLEKKLLTPDLIIKEVVSADLTAYTAGPESTGKSPGDPGYGVTASGAHVQDHRTIAVDPRKIPIGTKVYIEGIGVRVAEDTGGAIQGNRIDVYMSDLSAAIQFGYKRDVKVYILEESA